ncbi:hypothetical protein GSU68_03205 [Rathayibacter sp. VKM Ac-2759]|nr:hypothetical protein GSU68_03205 [Rathayibacter sp. VKM Ac-2759]
MWIGGDDFASADTVDVASSRIDLDVSATEPRTFTDVVAGQAFCADIVWMHREGITTGYPAAGGGLEYRPTENVSRQAMAAFLYRMSGESFSPPSRPSFSDVPTSNPFYTAVEWMKAKGITTGNADGTYAPDQDVSRQAMSAFLARLAVNPGFARPSASFSDVPAANPFFAQIEWMKAEGITTGNADGTFAPLAPVSRQAMAAFLHRYTQHWE